MKIFNQLLLFCTILGFSFSMNGIGIDSDLANVKRIQHDGLETYCGELNKSTLIYATYSSDTKKFSGMFVEKGNDPWELKDPAMWFGVLKEKNEEQLRIKDQQGYSDYDV